LAIYGIVRGAAKEPTTLFTGWVELTEVEMEKEGGACFAVYILILDIQSIQVRPVLFTGCVVPGHDETCESYCPFASRALLVPACSCPSYVIEVCASILIR
jgi:hypothetical protein